MDDIIKRVEALLFAAGRTISEQELAQLANASVHEVHHALEELKTQHHSRESPLLVIQEGDGWKLTVHEKYLPVVQQINPHTELSKAILETLAVIAWKQPAKQSDVIKIRTNKAYEHIDELERLGFVAKEKYGRTYLLKVTGKFFDYFDLPGEKGVKEIFKDVKDVEGAQAKLGLDAYGEKDEVTLQKEGKEHVGDLEVFEETESKPMFEEEPKEENPVQEFLNENQKPAPQEIEEGLAEEKEEVSEEPKSEERELSPELESMIKEKKKSK